ncbi:50S ribosomal protein L25/general stress protein Ctc [Corynebacterium sp. 320]|uniref:Large ribosomal subunit protein bL25 n=1 Tax=Corynebacterium zhongnanshanii TaxID=2768834 RepID=A0ABQ6VFD6_9CORY|nr:MULTISPECIES: 50S ribosomal protein L25/general stress protein Ctc [Corynebacterium]KAB1504055.1 50S ribosomal protein L25/general stress protein Ctc [Corynebacterium sp. 320]KAB1552846.1 50S ribosomal protein L25/general stress protein Ctc [Corynebacterium sp. 321]KAB1553936.1 50S ribosomal protein L25/general stress protein Ctc [Corynebacterium sp. 319]KAB3523090.1 50S ribosomal protein L25/general stress protein Ctc [Corynebacterium zhongnanshanii]KAB3528191.1 50S ribosomal protein L25/g
MAKMTRLEAQPRNEFGKGASRRLRRAGRIPAVVYGNEQEPRHISVDILEFHSLLRYEGVNAVFELVVEGEEHLVMVKAVDQNVLTLDVDHADLMNVKRGEKVEVEIPVVYTGEPAPGALVAQDADVIAVLADVLDIPEQIELDVEGLEIGTQITAGEIQMPSNCELVSEEDTLVINIVEPEEEELPEPGEEGEGDAVGEAGADEEESEESEDAEGESEE